MTTVLSIILLAIYGIGVTYYSLGFRAKGKVVRQRKHDYQQFIQQKYSIDTSDIIDMPEFLYKEIDDDYN